MTTKTQMPTKTHVAVDHRILLTGVSWGSYSRLLQIFGDRPHLRLTYDRGDLEIVSRSLRHEKWGGILSRFVVVLTEELHLPLASGGSVTMRRKSLKRGLEADKSFWIAHEADVRGIEDLDLQIHPPPDLVIEVEITRSALKRMGIYAKMRVPEVWRVTAKKIRFQQLQPDGAYKEMPTSLTFPGLTPNDLMNFLKLAGT